MTTTRSETAASRYKRLQLVGQHWADWSRFCSADSFCKTPCTDCAVEARRAAERLG